MKRLLTFLTCLFCLTAFGQYRPNYFDTNSAPFSVVPGVSIYVPTVYSTNGMFTNLSVTDYMFIGTAQINYLNMLGSLNQQGTGGTNYFLNDTNYFAGIINASKFFGDGSGLINLPSSSIPTLDQVTGTGNVSSNDVFIADSATGNTNISLHPDGSAEFADAVTAGNGFVETGGSSYYTAGGSYKSIALDPAIDPGGVDANGGSIFTIFTDTCAPGSGGEFLVGANGGSILSVAAYSTTNVSIQYQDSSLGSIFLNNNSNVEITASHSLVFGQPPSGYTNSFSGEMAMLTPNGKVFGVDSNGNAGFTGTVEPQSGIKNTHYSTNQTVTVVTNKTLYCVNGSNQVVYLCEAAANPWVIYRFVSTNGNGNFTLTNSTLDNATLRDGASHTLKQIGVGEVGLFSDGANWQLASKFRTVWPNASWSCTNSVVLPTAVATNMYFDTQEFNNSQGLALVGGNKFYITNFGEYFFTFSTVLTKTAGGAGNIYASIWPRQSGVDIPRSRTRISCYNQNDIRVMTVNFIFTVTTNNTYFDLMALCNAGGISLYAEGGYTNAPVMPSTIVTINRISDSRP